MDIRWITAFLDFEPTSFERGAEFWSAVTGYAVSAPRSEHPEFARLEPPDGDAYLRVQRLEDGPSRIHLDLHFDDVRRHADRAITLGARSSARRSSRQDPTGPCCATRPASPTASEEPTAAANAPGTTGAPSRSDIKPETARDQGLPRNAS
ncbi:hypothetical protein EK0264_06705 [Epidermidibacterium keratini]|uniref:Glyoxalase-like domain-containing protein n=1 Tax=Epidermidibacterium keratini TaxID=1891644 RepID=A0A7L4YLC5_9ACTN|nr:VOC family protein [Epidermidibacterium keratini]QHB99995.1 hypothetical protein EK0264_06705 [Epidermidibacterium keratini]